MALLQLNRIQDAINDFGAAIDANPRFLPAFRGRAVAFMRLGDLAAAQKDLMVVGQLRDQNKQSAPPRPPIDLRYDIKTFSPRSTRSTRSSYSG